MNNTDRLCLGCMNDNGGEKICPICGYDSTKPCDETALTPGTWIKERYLVGRVFEKNGEGITYIGWDNLNNNVVYVKEYFPQGLAIRNKNKSVAIVDGKEYDFNNGIMQFIEISKKMADLDTLPCVMPVIETVELGGTAYSIIKAAAGITLREFLLRNGGNLKWEQAKPLFLPLIVTLDGMHKAGLVHGGISPETVIVGRDGKLHIFGVSIPEIRIAGSEFASQVFPGFAAIEQYKEEFVMGTHTDVYSLAATLFRTLIGNPPMAAPERLERDNMSIPAKFAESIPSYVLSALANALQILPENRTRTMEDFRAALTHKTSDAPVRTGGGENNIVSAVNANKKYTIIAAAATAIFLLLIAAILVFTVFKDDIFGKKEPDVTSSVSAPSVSSHGDVDPNVSDEPIERTYDVPDFTKNEKGELCKYGDVIENVDYNQIFKFSIKETRFSDKHPEGTIIEQSVAAGQKVKKETEIAFVVSAGSSQIKLPNLAGKTDVEAYIELLELGFQADNIEFVDKYDETKEPQRIIDTDIAAGTKVSRFAKIIVYINSYEETASDYDTFSSENSSSN